MRQLAFLLAFAVFLVACGGAGSPSPDPPEASDPGTPLTADAIAELGLSGRLIYSQGEAGLLALDLVTGTPEILLAPQAGTTVEGVAVSPDGGQLAIAYTPELGPIVRTDLYLSNTDGSDLRPLLLHEGTFEDYANPVWSPDGTWIYFTHADVPADSTGSSGEAVLNVERIRADGQNSPEVFREDAEQISFSSDGTRMAYLKYDRSTNQRSVWVIDEQSGEERELLPVGAFTLISGLRIAPDGESVTFGASGALDTSLGASSPSFWQRWFGVQVAQAHGDPWELWTVPFAGGEPTPLTDWDTDSPWPAWSPDGRYLAALRPGGVYLVQSSGDVFLIEAGQAHGELAWTP